MIIYGGFLIWSKRTVDSYIGQYINATLIRLHGKNITLLRPIVLNAALDYTGKYFSVPKSICNTVFIFMIRIWFVSS
ncbi:unnamed protein product [Trichobilharzia regenti]|nr:unnamed protein product [Trichobilharzia regenti]